MINKDWNNYKQLENYENAFLHKLQPLSTSPLDLLPNKVFF